MTTPSPATGRTDVPDDSRRVSMLLGLLFGLGQFVTTFAITMGYRRWADRTLDGVAGRLRDQLESGDAR